MLQSRINENISLEVFCLYIYIYIHLYRFIFPLQKSYTGLLYLFKSLFHEAWKSKYAFKGQVLTINKF